VLANQDEITPNNLANISGRLGKAGENIAQKKAFSGQPLEPPKGKGPDFLNELLEAKSLG